MVRRFLVVVFEKLAVGDDERHGGSWRGGVGVGC